MSDIKELLKEQMSFLTDEQAERFAAYYDMLVYWNENRCNLTAITDPHEVIQKHFYDSVLPIELIPQNARCIDVGTGAGFPGVPLLILRPDMELVLLDTLKKRVDFLDALVEKLDLKCRTIHSRAEDAGNAAEFREKFDIALTRAVSQTNILLEWTSPFLKTGGKSLMYKGSAAKEELDGCDNALKILGLRAEVINFEAAWGQRAVICAQKLKSTPKAYPRKAGTAKKNPL